MSYVALYRKFRPSTFEEVKGQDHIVKTLKNQMRTDRLGHAYLFCGVRERHPWQRFWPRRSTASIL